jgi:hypothetical protein
MLNKPLRHGCHRARGGKRVHPGDNRSASPWRQDAALSRAKRNPAASTQRNHVVASEAKQSQSAGDIEIAAPLRSSR